MIFSLAICSALLLNANIEINHVKENIVINGRTIVCKTCGHKPCSVRVNNGEIIAYCKEHLPSDSFEELAEEYEKYLNERRNANQIK